MVYKRLVLHPDGRRTFEDFTPEETADKDALEQATANARADNLQRRINRARAVRLLKTVATGGGPNAPLATAILRLWLADPVDPDDPDPTV